MARDLSNAGKCQHIDSSEIEGYLICLKCGLSLDNFCFENSSICVDEDSINIIQNRDSKQNNQNFLERLKVELEEVYSKNFISYFVLQKCLFLVKNWVENKIPYEKYYLPYSIYYAACIENFPLTLKEISSFFQIPIKKFCQLSKILPIEATCPPFKFIEKYSYSLGINFKQCKEVDSLVALFQKKFTTNINIAIAVCLLKLDLNLSEDKIIEVTMVNKYTLRKYLNIF